MPIADSIATTVRRIGSVGKLLLGSGVRKLYEGIAVEFGRVAEYRDVVKCSTVPNANLCPESLDDLESKYGISAYGESTEQERIDRIVERATMFGSGGADWLEAQIQAAGFPLYVVENVPSQDVKIEKPEAFYKADNLSLYPDDPAGTTYYQDAWATVDGWATAGGSAAISNGKLTLTSSTTDLNIQKDFSGFAGSTQRTIRLRFDGAQPSSLGQVYYKTAGHGFSASYYKQFNIPLGGGVVDIDMSTLWVGGTDWVDSTITGVRLDFGNVSGQVFVLDWVYIGTGKYLDGSLQNQISDSYDGTIYGCTPDGAGGLIFDGINDYVEIPSPWAVDSVSKNITLCAVINVPSAELALTYPILDTWRSYGIKKGFILRLAKDKRLQFYNPQSGADNATTIGSALSSGIHVILAVLSDGQPSRFYDSGVLIGSGNSLPILHSGDPLWIGRSTINNGYANNVIAYQRWFNRALTDAEVSWIAAHPEYIPLTGYTQYGDYQMDITTQMGTLPSRIDPSTVPGILITSSPNRPGGGVIDAASQLGAQMGPQMQMGALSEDYSYPQPASRDVPTNAALWGGVFFLSPIEGRVATEDEMLYISDERARYLTKLVMQIKYLGRWCIAQVAQRVVRVTDKGDTRITEEGDTRRA